jgi:hypothetical protein
LARPFCFGERIRLAQANITKAVLVYQGKSFGSDYRRYRGSKQAGHRASVQQSATPKVRNCALLRHIHKNTENTDSYRSHAVIVHVWGVVTKPQYGLANRRLQPLGHLSNRCANLQTQLRQRKWKIPTVELEIVG